MPSRLSASTRLSRLPIIGAMFITVSLSARRRASTRFPASRLAQATQDRAMTAAPLGIALLAASALISTIGSRPLPHYVWNLTPSVPRGLYAVRPPDDLRVTALVLARPPEPLATQLDRDGYLPRGVPLLKRIFALSGQTVCRNGIQIRRRRYRGPRPRANATAAAGRCRTGRAAASSPPTRYFS